MTGIYQRIHIAFLNNEILDIEKLYIYIYYSQLNLNFKIHLKII